MKFRCFTFSFYKKGISVRRRLRRQWIVTSFHVAKNDSFFLSLLAAWKEMARGLKSAKVTQWLTNPTVLPVTYSRIGINVTMTLQYPSLPPIKCCSSKQCIGHSR